ncbi:hypothetical protein AAFF_G00289340 [Aldrovandia affinis]|uniref:Uncharacterized protein n=1 Tax=Aldrovandia affinis TaxID=143900 RepID=A0AAD7R9J6_9TELE|nr:hypothetical protein AAFF_G00289340 [Aldrovandia affinis]
MTVSLQHKELRTLDRDRFFKNDREIQTPSSVSEGQRGSTLDPCVSVTLSIILIISPGNCCRGRMAGAYVHASELQSEPDSL